MKRKLTDAYVRTAKPTGQRRLVWDLPAGAAQSSGLALVVGPSGRKYWKSCYRDRQARRLVWISHGPWPKVSLAEARDLNAEVQLQAQRAKRDREAYPHEERAAKAAHDDRPTVADAAGEWLTKYAKRKLKSWAASARYLDHDILPNLGEIALVDLTTRDVRNWHAQKQPTAPIAAAGARKVLSSMLGWAVEQDKIETNPALGVRSDRPAERDRAFEPDEIRRLWHALEREGDTGLALRLSLLCGLRVGEALNLKRSQLHDQWAVLPGSVVKNKKTHRCWLPDAAMAIIEAGHGEGDRVFATRSSVHSSRYDRIWQRAEITDAQGRDCRRTCASNLARLGAEERVIELALNHSYGPKVTHTYNKYKYEPKIVEAMEAWATDLMGIVDGPTVIKFKTPSA